MDKAVALEYDGTIPKIIAKAQGELLDILIKMAENNNIAIYQDADLAELLSTLNEGDNIPDELFLAVAEVFVHCYETNKKMKDKVDRSVSINE